MQAEIEIDGDEVTINSLVIESPELVAYLDDYEEDRADAIEDLIEIALDIRSKFQTDLETQNIKDSAESVIASIEQAYEQMVEDLNEKLAEIVDPEKGPVIKALDEKSAGVVYGGRRFSLVAQAIGLTNGGLHAMLRSRR